MRVLLIEENAALGKHLADRLRKGGFVVDWMSDLKRIERALDAADCAAIVLGVALLPENAAAEISKLRKRDDQILIIAVCASTEPAKRVLLLNAGADDCLTNPPDPDELVARMRAVMRRIKHRPAAVVNVRGIQLDPVQRTVLRDGQSIPVTASEFELLAVLMAEPGRYVTRAALEQQLYGWMGEVASNSVEVHIHNLRRKLGESFIRNVRGRGYRVAADDT